MRWRFFDPNNQEEAAARKAVITKIDAWWEQFQSKTDQLSSLFSGKSKWDLPEWMHEHLQIIDANLMWEYGPAVHTRGHRLVITPESSHHLRPLVATILQRAPSIKGWEFYEYRLPEDAETMQATVQSRTGCDCSDFTVRITCGELRDIDLCYSAPGFTDETDQASNHAAFVTTESLLGEKCLDRWIGAIEISPLTKGSKPPRFIQLERMKETVDSLIDSIREQLPENPHYDWVEGAEWTMWELKPDRTTNDFPEQLDLFVGSSINPEMWMTAHSGRSFYSERFSRCGETFCYVKIDGSEGLDEEKFADKSEIEDALNAVLKPGKLGCHIGGGTGLRYSYLDLALTDLDNGIKAVRKRLQEGNVPKRSWIQFFDSDLAAEWIGIYDDSPAPPLTAMDE